MCGSRKYPYPTHGKSFEISKRGRETQNLQILDESIKANLTSQSSGEGLKPGQPLW